MKNDLKTRKLTVTYQIQQQPTGNYYIKVPKIRLAGKWLYDAGFKAGDKIEVKVDSNRITVCKIKQTTVNP